MPFQRCGVQRASLRFPIEGAVSWLRSPRPWLGALTLAFLAPLAPAPLMLSTTVSAASPCAGWPSRIKPPPSVRVLRTATGRVEDVQLATYVATVMASGEWPTWLPRAALEVGATATKQYVWYYLLEGHHRTDYRTPSGECYDVRDDTNDQLYRPETAVPTQKQIDALAATWALSLRKNRSFFLTGYRMGANVACAHDADGWRLYAQSVERCARQGWSRQRIQKAYLGPHLRFVWDVSGGGPATTGKDRRAPIVTTPRVLLQKRSVLGGAVGTVAWSGGDAGSGIAGYEVEQRVEEGDWTALALKTPAAHGVAVSLDTGSRYEFRVRARDRAGNLSGWAVSAPAASLVEQSDAAHMGGHWSLVSEPEASGGSMLRAKARGAMLSLAFRGRSVAIVAPTGPGHGIMRVRVAGLVVATIHLGRLPADDQRLVWVRTWHASRDRRVGVVVTRTPGASSVDVDAFVVLR